MKRCICVFLFVLLMMLAFAGCGEKTVNHGEESGTGTGVATETGSETESAVGSGNDSVEHPPFEGEHYRLLNDEVNADVALMELLLGGGTQAKEYVKEQGSFRIHESTLSGRLNSDTNTIEKEHAGHVYEVALSENNGFYSYAEHHGDGDTEYSYQNERELWYGENKNGYVSYRHYVHNTSKNGEEYWFGEDKDTTSDIAANLLRDSVERFIPATSFECSQFSLYSYEYEDRFYAGDNTLKMEIKGEYSDSVGYSKIEVDFVYVANLSGAPLSIRSRVKQYDSEDKINFVLVEEEQVDVVFEYGVAVEKLDRDSFGFTGVEESNRQNASPSPSPKD